MKHPLKAAEPLMLHLEYSGPYQEIAVSVRNLLGCDYALIATTESDSIRIQAIVGGEGENSRNLAMDVMSKLGDWGRLIVDDSRLITVPVLRDGAPIGLLAGYSLKRGRFTVEDLEKLAAYGLVAAGILGSTAAESSGATKTSFSMEELLHLSRLIAMGELSASFAHEAGTPLTLIRGHLRFALQALPQDHPLRINLEAISRASRRIEEMSKSMLDFSRKRPPNTEPCNITEIVSDAVRVVQPNFRTKGVEVLIQLDPALPPVTIDRWPMIQAIVNVLQNATDAMVELDKRVLSIRGKVEGNHLQIAISDTGTGIPTADLPSIFDPFFTTKGERGTGLGLYITKQVIDNHHGTITAASGDRGTTFTITLPI